MTGFIFGLFLCSAGVFMILKAVFDRFFRSYVPNPKRWAKAKARVTGRKSFTEKTAPSKYRAQSAYLKSYEKEIRYTANGKTYTKYIPDNESGTLIIYYKRKNPDYFKTLSDIKSAKRQGKSNAGLAFTFFMGAVVTVVGVVCLGLC